MNRYVTTITSESLCLEELKLLYDLKKEIGDNRITLKKTVIEKNLFNYRSAKATETRFKRLMSRLESLDNKIKPWLFSENMIDQKLVALLSVYKTSSLFKDYIDIEIDELKTHQSYLVDRGSVRHFFSKIESDHPEIREWSDATIQKLESLLPKFLKNVGVINSVGKFDQIHPTPKFKNILKTMEPNFCSALGL
jgi:uncharacterized protein YdcH (DUF465 family)